MIAPSVATARLSAAGNPICGVTVLTRSVRSSGTSMLLMMRFSVALAEASDCGDIWRSRLNLASCAVTGSPLWNLRPGRIWKVQPSPSSAISHFSATPGPTPPFSRSNPTSGVHRRLIDRVAGPRFKDRVHRLRRQRLDGEDQRALLGFRRGSGPRESRNGCREEQSSRNSSLRHFPSKYFAYPPDRRPPRE